MGFLPGFDADVCISYSSIDDKKLSIHQMGWVDHLYCDLKIQLDKHLAQEAAVWRDKWDLPGNAVLKESLDKSFRSSATLVPVIAPRYFTSEWCQFEYKAFQSAAQSREVLNVDAGSRIFKVVKQPVALEDMPPELQEVTPYVFYKIDPDTGRPRDFDPELDKASQYDYVRKVDDLASDIAKFLRGLKNEKTRRASRATIYLALTTSDLQDTRDSMQRELKSRDFAILPDRELRVSDANFRDKIARMLPDAAASIHLIGETYGEIPKGETRSLGEVQATLAAEHCAVDPAFRRVIWMPPKVESGNQLQQNFINALREDSTAQKQTPIIEKEIEELKEFLLDLFPIRTVRDTGSGRKLYVIVPPEDMKSEGLASLLDYVFVRGFDVELSLPGKDQENTRSLHEKYLKSSDAYLIYYGSEDQLWFADRLAECGQFAARPIAAYIVGPETPAKQYFRSRNVALIRNYGSFSSEALAVFLDSMASKGHAY